MRPLLQNGLNRIIWWWININVLFSRHKYETLVNAGQTKIWENKQQKLLGIVIDRDFKFDEYVLSQCKKSR